MVADRVLADTDRQEAMSRAFVQAIAASAGYTTSQPDFDRDSVDLKISAGGSMRPQVHVQLKATINLKLQNGNCKFPLPIKNYDDLRIETQAPRILVVLAMPRREPQWLNVNQKRMILRRTAYWLSLRGQPEVDNTASVTVTIPEQNHFTVDALRALMEKSRRGDVL